MNKDLIKGLAKEHGTALGAQVLVLIGQALINFANHVANPKKAMDSTGLSVVNSDQFARPNFDLKKSDGLQ